MPRSEDAMEKKYQYNKAYNQQNYSVIKANILKEDLETVNIAAKERGLSVSELILESLRIAYGIDVRKDRNRNK